MLIHVTFIILKKLLTAKMKNITFFLTKTRHMKHSVENVRQYCVIDETNKYSIMVLKYDCFKLTNFIKPKFNSAQLAINAVHLHQIQAHSILTFLFIFA